MSERFFSSEPIQGENARLEGAEAHHLIHVMRAGVGDAVTLFDGSGAEFSAVVAKLRRAEVELAVVERREVNRELPFSLTLGVALPKGDRQKWLVEKLTELGVTELVPLVTARGVAQPNRSAIDRLQRSVVEASKQCGRNRLMQIAEPLEWSEWLARAGGDRRRLLAHPGGIPAAALLAGPAVATAIAIGPEGGFTTEEVEAALAAGWQPVGLGPRILRVETAAVALAAAVTSTSS